MILKSITESTDTILNKDWRSKKMQRGRTNGKATEENGITSWFNGTMRENRVVKIACVFISFPIIFILFIILNCSFSISLPAKFILYGSISDISSSIRLFLLCGKLLPYFLIFRYLISTAISCLYRFT